MLIITLSRDKKEVLHFITSILYTFYLENQIILFSPIFFIQIMSSYITFPVNYLVNYSLKRVFNTRHAGSTQMTA